jgi:hypothetical protein
LCVLVFYIQDHSSLACKQKHTGKLSGCQMNKRRAPGLSLLYSNDPRHQIYSNAGLCCMIYGNATWQNPAGFFFKNTPGHWSWNKIVKMTKGSWQVAKLTINKRRSPFSFRVYGA